jgi:ribonuclease III
VFNINSLAASKKYTPQALEILAQKFPLIHSNIAKLESILGYTFRNKVLASAALTHRSALVYWNSQEAPIASNEVLEFYGDSVLNFVVSTAFLESFSNYKEGDLSKMRASVVGTENLAQKCEDLGFHFLLITGKGEQVSGGSRKLNILADCFESILGALAIDAGILFAQDWLKRVLAADLIAASENLHKNDSKSALQQLVQKICNIHPNYKLLGSESTHTETQFIVGVFVGPIELARAKAVNKRDASKAAATEVLNRVSRGELKESDFLRYASTKV